MTQALVVLAVLLPLAGAALHGLLAVRGRAGAPMLAVATVLGSLLTSAVLLVQGVASNPAELTFGTWIAFDDWSIRPGFHVDGLSVLFAMLVTIISTAAHLSVRALSADSMPRRAHARLFAALQGLTASAVILVYAGDLTMMLLGWQLVALFGYLLVSLRGEDAASTGAATKAFVVGRIGDLGLVIAAAALLVAFDTADLSKMAEIVETDAQIERLDINVEQEASIVLDSPVKGLGLSLAALIAAGLVLAGAVRMAQFPLQVWLPDTSVAPAPANAMIQGATTAATGAYLLARLSFVIALAPGVLGVAMLVGGATAVAGALGAWKQNDIRRAIASVAIGHFGLVLLAAGSGSFAAAIGHSLTVSVGIAASVLAAGAISKARGGVTDLRRLGGDRTPIRVASMALGAGLITLAAIPPFGGFFTASGALIEARTAFNETMSFAPITGYLLGAVGLFLLAGASLRILTLATAANPSASTEANAAASTFDGDASQPLGGLALVTGFLAVPPLLGFGLLPNAAADLMGKAVRLVGHYPAGEGARAGEIEAVLVALVAAVAGAAVGVALGRRIEAALPEKEPAASPLLDRIYIRVILQPLDRLTLAFAWIETRVVDRIITSIARIVRFAAFLLSRFLNGDVQYYGIVMILGVAGFILYQVLS